MKKAALTYRRGLCEGGLLRDVGCHELPTLAQIKRDLLSCNDNGVFTSH